ncbi:hypothetical protein VTO42DRAFT_5298 [Malbranchea cinnamomea]
MWLAKEEHCSYYSKNWLHHRQDNLYVDHQATMNGDDGEEYDDLIADEREWPGPARSVSGRKKSLSTATTTILVALNSLLTLASILTLIITARKRCKCIEGPEPPYSPLYEAGAVRYVNKLFSPERIFQMEPGLGEVEEAWNEALGSTEGIVQLPKEIAAKLPETVEIFFEPGYYVYGVSAHHQLHCLNRIRQSFYPELFFPNETKEEIIFHKNHCIDLLRQSIMCNGDPSLVYWWNSNYSYLDANGVKHYTEEYLSMSEEERVAGSFVKWEVKTQCRDWDAISDWVNKNKLQENKHLKKHMERNFHSA